MAGKMILRLAAMKKKNLEDISEVTELNEEEVRPRKKKKSYQRFLLSGPY